VIAALGGATPTRLDSNCSSGSCCLELQLDFATAYNTRQDRTGQKSDARHYCQEVPFLFALCYLVLRHPSPLESSGFQDHVRGWHAAGGRVRSSFSQYPLGQDFPPATQTLSRFQAFSTEHTLLLRRCRVLFSKWKWMDQKSWTADQHAALSFDASDRLCKLPGLPTASHAGSWLTGTRVGRMAL